MQLIDRITILQLAPYHCCFLHYPFVLLYYHDIGYYTSPAFSAGSIDSSVFLSPAVPLPAPEQFSVKLKDQQPVSCQVESTALSSKKWASNFHETKPFQIEPSRIFTFR